MKLVLVGTGTGVGKTTLACALLSAATEPGLTSWKPIETGGTDDADALRRAGTRHHPTVVSLRTPVSPHLAARLEGRRIDPRQVADQAPPGPWLVETAGGLFTPLDDDGRTNLDLVVALQPDHVWLVARNRLGVLHDVLATVRAARAERCLVTQVVLNTFGPVDDSTSTNLAELRRLLDVPVLDPAEAVATFTRSAR
ncbi:MAG: dethiobiotin synthase [Myxococcales bacterium]|nr:dethiobiotin synthase [Myxococcales bacterium]